MFGPTWSILEGTAEDRLQDIPDESVQCCVTSPPYWGQRVYKGCPSTFGLEATQEEYVAKMVHICEGVRRTLKSSGVFWLNIGDGFYCKSLTNRNGATDHLGGKTRGGGEYALPKRADSTLKPKDLCGTPWAVAFALRDAGWYLRDAVIWHKPAPMPGGAKDRCVSSYEFVFMLAKSRKYMFNTKAMSEPGVTTDTRRRRNVWSVPSANGNGWHFACMPQQLVKTCIKGTSRQGDCVLDPFHGSGTTGIVANRMGRQYVGIEPCAEYIEKSEQHFAQEEHGARPVSS
jgi:site-specific DNA-methyltransferase (adenine-specific)